MITTPAPKKLLIISWETSKQYQSLTESQKDRAHAIYASLSDFYLIKGKCTIADYAAGYLGKSPRTVQSVIDGKSFNYRIFLILEILLNLNLTSPEGSNQQRFHIDPARVRAIRDLPLSSLALGGDGEKEESDDDWN